MIRPVITTRQYSRDLWLLMDFWSTYFKFEITWLWSSLLVSLNEYVLNSRLTRFPSNSDLYVISPKKLVWCKSSASDHGLFWNIDPVYCVADDRPFFQRPSTLEDRSYSFIDHILWKTAFFVRPSLSFKDRLLWTWPFKCTRFISHGWRQVWKWLTETSD